MALMHSPLFILWKFPLIFVSLNFISLHRILWNCNLKCGMEQMQIAGGGTSRNGVSSSNSMSKSLNDAFWTFPSHFEWFIAQPLLCETMTDRTIPTVSIANWNYILYMKAYHQNQTKPNEAESAHSKTIAVGAKRANPVCMLWMVSCAQCKCNSMQSKKFSYRMQIFTHLISFCLSSCSLIHYFHICKNFQNKIRWNFMIIHACDKWLDAHKNSSNNSTSNNIYCDFGKSVLWRKLMVWQQYVLSPTHSALLLRLCTRT